MYRQRYLKFIFSWSISSSKAPKQSPDSRMFEQRAALHSPEHYHYTPPTPCTWEYQQYQGSRDSQLVGYTLYHPTTFPLGTAVICTHCHQHHRRTLWTPWRGWWWWWCSRTHLLWWWRGGWGWQCHNIFLSLKPLALREGIDQMGWKMFVLA